jgi:lipid II:glycine glycyltransferase (peptidoglycan interpeptide bridge formation enzyme)
MNIMLCRSNEGVCAGLVWSAIGKTGIELFAATSDAGTKTGGSYLLRWKLVEKLKQNRFGVYNLNGINPIRNPGTYRFKAELAGKNGKDVYYLGRFDACFPGLSSWSVACGDTLRTIYRKSKGLVGSVRSMKLRPETAN